MDACPSPRISDEHARLRTERQKFSRQAFLTYRAGISLACPPVCQHGASGGGYVGVHDYNNNHHHHPGEPGEWGRSSSDQCHSPGLLEGGVCPVFFATIGGSQELDNSLLLLQQLLLSWQWC
ncbi:unnamed protein product [Lampetra planeri]